jgi:hypothetical protein
MTKKNLKKMPIITPKDGEIEHHNAYTRLNPKGHEEFVVKRGNKDEETLNEIAEELDILCREYMEMGETTPAVSAEQPMSSRTNNIRFTPRLVSGSYEALRTNGDTISNMTSSTKLAADLEDDGRSRSDKRANSYYGPRFRPSKENIGGNKNIDSPTGDSLDYGATHNESFTGTAGIAFGPVEPTYDHPSKKGRKKKDKSRQVSENFMNPIDRLLLEWQPEFKAGQYDPGDYQMPSPTGNGVASKNAKKDNTGARDTEFKHSGKPWPRKHKETVAMCDVEEDGVENKPQGGHESTHGDPSDGITSELGHNWPNPPKHKGGGVGEPFEGNRWTDGGTLKGQGPHDGSNTGAKARMPKDGPITGVKGPQLGQPMEWSPGHIGKMIGESHNLQALFDNYARDNQQVDLESFQYLCDAHGTGVTLDESTFINLMSRNSEFMFHEHVDSDGPFWITTINEMEVKSPEDYFDDMSTDEDSMDTTGPFNKGMDDMYDMDNMDDGIGDINFDDMGDDDFGSSGDFDREFGGGRFGVEDMDGVCPACAYRGMEDECPSCHEMMMKGEGDIPQEDMADDDFDSYDDFEDEGAGPTAIGTDYWSYKGQNERVGPTDRYEMGESVSRLVKSTKEILENAKGHNKSAVTKALNNNWQKYGRKLALESITPTLQHTLRNIKQVFPGFKPICESGSHVMDAASGKSIAKKNLTKSPDLADQPGPDDIETHGDKSLLGKSQKNTLDGTPVIKGTAKGLSGTGEVSESAIRGDKEIMRDNVDRLTRKIKSGLAESAKRVGQRAKVSFAVAVNEGGGTNITPVRNTLAESVADLEEILQLHNVDDVQFVATFKDAAGSVVLRQELPLATINSRGPVVAEGRAIFRFKRNAEQFAEACNKSGVSCKIMEHAWGSAVQAPINMKKARNIFEAISEKNWLKGAVNPEHKGYCTPMTKSTCTPKRKALAKRFKKDGDLYSGKD